MDKRLELHEILVSLFNEWYRETYGNNKEHLGRVYFQPPENVKLTYPCIIYDLERLDVRYANNQLYKKKRRYNLSFIDKNPDTTFPDKLVELSYCSLDRSYTADNLNHYSFTIYY